MPRAFRCRAAPLTHFPNMNGSWHIPSSMVGSRTPVLAPGRVGCIDVLGRALLRRWRENGAHSDVNPTLAKTSVASIPGEPVVSAVKVARRDRWGWLRAFASSLIPLIAVLSPLVVHAASLEPATSKSWEEYVESANTRMAQRLSPGKSFLWVDESRDRLAKVRAGEIVVSQVAPQGSKRVQAGLIHHWVGAVFISQVTLRNVLQAARDYSRYKEWYKPTVIDSRIIASDDTQDRFSMRVVAGSLFLKTKLDTDYESRYVHVDEQRVYSVSRTTRIQEIEVYGSAAQRVRREGEGNAIVWRLFNITRYAERDGGVYLEIEALGLSRDIPASLRWLVEPIVDRFSREALSTTLRQNENAVRLSMELAKAKTGSAGSLATAAR